MKRHVPVDTAHGDEECVVCGATRSAHMACYLGAHPFYRFKLGPWRLAGQPARYCPGKREEKHD